MAFKILGIESSCDETAAAVVEDGFILRSSAVASQIERHREFGGVVPELASRLHIGAIIPVIDEALERANIDLKQIDAIAVTQGPGLVGALLVGVMAAKGLAMMTQKPLLPVHHLAAHLAAVRLSHDEIKPPFLALLTSGGHTHIIDVISWCNYQIIARTRDDSAGETLDKVARFLGLGYPGGPKIEQTAQGGNTAAFLLPHPRFDDSLDFSFSGLKTAARIQFGKLEQEARRRNQMWQDIMCCRDFAATVQHKVFVILTDHTERALVALNRKRLVVAGGVAANHVLRQQLQEMATKHDVKVFFPKMELCTDNAAMVAAAGYDLWQNRDERNYLDYGFDARSSWSLEAYVAEIQR